MHAFWWALTHIADRNTAGEVFGTFRNTVPGLGVRNVPEQPRARRFGALRAPYQIRKVRFFSLAPTRFSSRCTLWLSLFDPALYCATPGAHVDRIDTETTRRSRTDRRARHADNTRHEAEARGNAMPPPPSRPALLSLSLSPSVNAAARTQSSSPTSRSSCVEKWVLKE